MAITQEIISEYIKKIVEDNVMTIDWEGYEVKVNYLVDSAIISTIADAIVAACFAEDGTYNPYLKEFTAKCLIITAYTDIQLPEDIASKYALIYGTDIFETVIEQICGEQIAELQETVDKRIEYKVKVSTDAVMGRILEIYAQLESAVGTLMDSVGNISAEDMEKFVVAVSNSKLDEEKLIKAIVSQKE